MHAGVTPAYLRAFIASHCQKLPGFSGSLVPFMVPQKKVPPAEAGGFSTFSEIQGSYVFAGTAYSMP